MWGPVPALQVLDKQGRRDLVYLNSINRPSTYANDGNVREVEKTVQRNLCFGIRQATETLYISHSSNQDIAVDDLDVKTPYSYL